MASEPTSYFEAHAWLNSGDADLFRAAAVYLFGSLDAIPKPAGDTPVATLRNQIREQRFVRACADRDPHCGCDLPTCRAMLGDHDDGAKSSRENCLRCLTDWRLA